MWAYEGFFVTISTVYKDWRKNGLHQEWTSDNGQILVERNYSDGKRNGTWINYYQSAMDYANSTGIKFLETTYLKGIRSGQTIRYYQIGVKEYEGYWLGDQKIGRWTYFSEDGAVKRIMNYVNKQ